MTKPMGFSLWNLQRSLWRRERPIVFSKEQVSITSVPVFCIHLILILFTDKTKVKPHFKMQCFHLESFTDMVILVSSTPVFFVQEAILAT